MSIKFISWLLVLFPAKLMDALIVSVWALDDNKNKEKLEGHGLDSMTEIE